MAESKIKSGTFIVKRFTRTNYSSIPAGSVQNLSIPITTPSGYKAAGVVGFGGSGNGNIQFCDFNVSSDTDVSLWGRNNSGSAVTPAQLRVDVLFIRTDLLGGGNKAVTIPGKMLRCAA